jgi:hypothetical protein
MLARARLGWVPGEVSGSPGEVGNFLPHWRKSEGHRFLDRIGRQDAITDQINSRVPRCSRALHPVPEKVRYTDSIVLGK